MTVSGIAMAVLLEHLMQDDCTVMGDIPRESYKYG